MSIYFDFSKKPPFVQLLFLAFLMVIGALLSMLFSYVVGYFIWGKEVIFSNFTQAELINSGQISYLKFTQFCNQVGMFLVPAIIFALFSGKKTCDFLQMRTFGRAISLLLAIVIVFAITPFITMLQEWNESIVLPESLRTLETMMKTLEDNANMLTKIFVETDSYWVLSFNILLMAALPAFSEELIFRGVIQNIFQKWTKSSVWAIIITAIIFSGFHFQFYGFFPRFILGAVLGCLYVLSGSLWVPILAHFVINTSAVILGYLEFNQYISFGMEDFGHTNHPIYSILSVAVVLGLFWLMKKSKKEQSIL